MRRGCARPGLSRGDRRRSVGSIVRPRAARRWIRGPPSLLRFPPNGRARAVQPRCAPTFEGRPWSSPYRGDRRRRTGPPCRNSPGLVGSACDGPGPRVPRRCGCRRLPRSLWWSSWLRPGCVTCPRRRSVSRRPGLRDVTRSRRATLALAADPRQPRAVRDELGAFSDDLEAVIGAPGPTLGDSDDAPGARGMPATTIA